jgi:hypothetical protein
MLEQFLAWMRTQRGSQELRALLVFDEVYGFDHEGSGEFVVE